MPDSGKNKRRYIPVMRRNLKIVLEKSSKHKGWLKIILGLIFIIGIVTAITGLVAKAIAPQIKIFRMSIISSNNVATNNLAENFGQLSKAIIKVGRSIYCALNVMDPSCSQVYEYVEATEYQEAQKERYGVFAYPASSKNIFTFSMDKSGNIIFAEPIIITWRVEVNFPKFATYLKYPSVQFNAYVENTGELEKLGSGELIGDLATALDEVGTDINTCITLSREKYTAWKGVAMVSVTIPYECLINLKNLVSEGLPSNFYAKVHFVTTYESSEVTDYYILVVKPSVVQLANLRDQTVWDYLKVPIEKYASSRWLGLPGYYISLGIGSKNPTPLLSDADKFTIYFTFRKNDEDVKIEKIKDIKFCIPEYLEVINSQSTIKLEESEDQTEKFGRWKLICYKPQNIEVLERLLYLFDEGKLKEGEFGGAITLRIKDNYKKSSFFKDNDYFDLYIKAYLSYVAKKDYMISVKYTNIGGGLVR